MLVWLKQTVGACWRKCTYTNISAVSKQAISLILDAVSAISVSTLSAQSIVNFLNGLVDNSSLPGNALERQQKILDDWGLPICLVVCFATIGVGTAHAFRKFRIEAITGKAPAASSHRAWKFHGQVTALMKGIQSGASIANMTTFFSASRTHGFRFWLAIISAVTGGVISLPQLFSYFASGSTSRFPPWFSAIMYSFPNAALQLHELVKMVTDENDETQQIIYGTLVALLGIIVTFDIYKTYRNINVRKKVAQENKGNGLTEEEVETLIKEKFLQEQVSFTKEIAAMGSGGVSSAVTGFQIYMDLEKLLVQIGATEKPFYMLMALLLPVALLSTVLRWMRSYVTRVKWFITDNPSPLSALNGQNVQEDDVEAAISSSYDARSLGSPVSNSSSSQYGTFSRSSSRSSISNSS